MPELPEVESLRRSLIPVLVGRTIQKVSVIKPKLVSSMGTVRVASIEAQQRFERDLLGEKVKNITRRAKNLIISFESDKVLLIHLKMTGQLVYQSFEKHVVIGGHPIQESESVLPHKHSHIIFELDQGTLYYNDVRMFGYVLLYDSLSELEQIGHFAKLGMDPLHEEFDRERFGTKLKQSRSTLKSALMNQNIVTGLGNIYADEVCFWAGIRPDRKGITLKESEIDRLYEGIRTIIPKAVSMGGSSVANYIMADGSRGTFAHEHKVYNRGGHPCLICGTKLSRVKLNGRTTVYCEVCQI